MSSSAVGFKLDQIASPRWAMSRLARLVVAVTVSGGGLFLVIRGPG